MASLTRRSLTIVFIQAFDTEMQSFFYLFTRYLSERARRQELCALILNPKVSTCS